MRNQEMFGNLEGMAKKSTSKLSERLAEYKTFEPCMAIDQSKFAADESFKINKDLEELNISELIKNTKNGCSDSFNIIDLSLREYLRVISVSRTVSNKKNTSLVFDNVQETIFKIYKNILVGGFDDVEKVDHLTYKARGILKNTMFDIDRPELKNGYYTKTRLFKVSEDGEYEISSIDSLGKKTTMTADSILDDENFEDSELLQRALNKLNDSQKTIIDLYYFQNWGHIAISEELDISENSSMSHLKRAKKKLREEYLKA